VWVEIREYDKDGGACCGFWEEQISRERTRRVTTKKSEIRSSDHIIIAALGRHNPLQDLKIRNNQFKWVLKVQQGSAVAGNEQSQPEMKQSTDSQQHHIDTSLLRETMVWQLWLETSRSGEPQSFRQQTNLRRRRNAPCHGSSIVDGSPVDASE
jgi:hypothetical protein